MTKTILITLNSIRAVTRFVEVNTTAKADARVHITDEIIVAGDSIMGLFSANLLEPLKVEITAENETDVERLLEKYDQEGLSFLEGD